jgi:hypothetical protein
MLCELSSGRYCTSGPGEHSGVCALSSSTNAGVMQRSSFEKTAGKLSRMMPLHLRLYARGGYWTGDQDVG